MMTSTFHNKKAKTAHIQAQCNYEEVNRYPNLASLWRLFHNADMCQNIKMYI